MADTPAIVERALWEALRFFENRDEMRSQTRLHTTTKWSPLTELLRKALAEIKKEPDCG